MWLGCAASWPVIGWQFCPSNTTRTTGGCGIGQLLCFRCLTLLSPTLPTTTDPIYHQRLASTDWRDQHRSKRRGGLYNSYSARAVSRPHLGGKELKTSADVLHLLNTQNPAVWSSQLFAWYDLQQLGQQFAIAQVLKQVVDLQVNLQRPTNTWRSIVLGNYQPTNHPFYGHYTRQPAVNGTSRDVNSQEIAFPGTTVAIPGSRSRLSISPDYVLLPAWSELDRRRGRQLRTVGAKFYCPHALADGNQRIRIREKTLKFFSTA